MAFSPFNVFRRNQRAIFAVVTVFIMFTFVLSSGLGGGADFFDWFPRQFGGGGDRLCTIDGDRVNDRDVRELRLNRVMANRYMLLAATDVSGSLRRDAQEKLLDATPTLANPARAVLEGKDPQAMGMFQMLSGMMANAPNARQADKSLVAVIDAWLTVERHKAFSEQAGGTYFLNAPNRTVRDAIDFMLWERKATAMGIEFTDDDVKKLVRREFFEQFRNDIAVREYMTREYAGRFTPNAIWRALAAEFKVRAAQTALLGPVSESSERTATAAPIFTTPFDLFSYYKDKASPTEYRALAVPASSFASQVTGEPSDGDVQRLFNDRKDYEPDPSKEEFGFKEPRKVKIEWVAASGDEPYYKKAAADWISRTELFAKGGVATLTVPTPGVGPAGWAAAATAPMSLTEPLVQSLYQGKVTAHKQSLSFKWTEADRVSPVYLLDSSYTMWTNRAERTHENNLKKLPYYAAGPELAAMITGLGTTAIGGNSIVQPAAFHAQAVAHESRDRGISGGLLFLAGVPGPGLLGRVVVTEAAYRQTLPPPPPVEALRAELLTDLTDRKARELAVTDLRKLQTELVKLGNNGRPADKGAAARAYVAEFIKERGLKTGATPEGVSTWTVRDEPALAPLRDSQKAPPGFDPHGGMNVNFGQRFFTSIDPKRGVPVTASGLYLPEFYPEQIDPRMLTGKDPLYMAWRTDDQAARSIPLQTAKPRVVEAWRRSKGREDAKKVAEDYAARIRAVPGNAPAQFALLLADLQGELQGKFADPKAKQAVKLFKLDNVSPIQILNDVNGMARMFSLAGIPDLPFPTADMAKQLVDHRLDPVKTVLVIPDAAKDTYYVFVLTGRQERGVEEFRAHLYSPMGRGPVRELVLAGHARDAVIRARDSVMAMLRTEFKYEETDAQKAKLDERDKKGEE
ncbi:hypothetical protein [Urbifossiella limnaea]|uniref:Uncharacterized protein n=1 Tax=Urbifossiella limnaea TaxID=2528023 RepID=A0A517XZ34_9BACT|nr:hypothetical protein [Urbifossiella limnaea]QDU22776.1 hypothetical protein ETAA1_47640 [Urbifossiella limnaea]